MKKQNSRKINKILRLGVMCLFIFAFMLTGVGDKVVNLTAGASQPALQNGIIIESYKNLCLRSSPKIMNEENNFRLGRRARHDRKGEGRKNIRTEPQGRKPTSDRAGVGPSALQNGNVAQSEEIEKKPQIAIVIDDFGMDRRGVEEMLSVEAPLTVAVLPGLDYSTEDATRAHEKGHEVILHMPMENQSYMPPEYYGPKVVKNNMSEQEAVSLVRECINSIPFAVGMNIHMGTGVSRNEKIISAIMEEMKMQDKYFLDSKTIEETVCPCCADKVGVRFFLRDIFLEPSGRPNYDVAYNYLMEAGNLALEKGKVVVIGHVGPVGSTDTAKAIKNALKAFENMGVEVVPLSAF